MFYALMSFAKTSVKVKFSSDSIKITPSKNEMLANNELITSIEFDARYLIKRSKMIFTV